MLVIGVLLIAVIGFLLLGLLGSFLHANASDAAGNAMSQAFGAMFNPGPTRRLRAMSRQPSAPWSGFIEITRTCATSARPTWLWRSPIKEMADGVWSSCGSSTTGRTDFFVGFRILLPISLS